ncbi:MULTISPECIES: RebB family R body protein [Pseudoalteromonas]|uniref:RebB family R body protein n=1 Tax=Pseudoalteromonas TaxID=53246 RepID=UPI001EF661CB|nr:MULTISPECIES: RebB family R body protein [Pseudoalteromonas]MCG7560216.1 RebB family R body protein [Pseudoalteromonas sp. McH1-42]MEC4088846.1 RebB family R body protein [Pseudoalteromonas rubra]
MAFPTAVNSQITDSVSQVNTNVLGDSPAVATGNFMLATSQALANAAHQATLSQRFSKTPVARGVDMLYGIDTATTAVGTSRIFS